MQIIPIKDLRDTNKVSALCSATNEPIFVTKNGYGDMVVMSMKAYENYEQMDILNKVMQGKLQADNNQLLDGGSVMQELKDKYVK